MRKIPTREEIEAIVACDNLVVRNLQITQNYYRLSYGMRRFMSRKNVSWLAFATHASKTAGQALRHELMPRTLKSAMIRMAGYDNTYFYLNDALRKPNPALTRKNNSLLAEALKRVSRLVSEGNVMVFAELAYPFAMMINAFSNDWKYDQRKLNMFLREHFRPGPLEQDGQDYLIEAVSAYYRARFESNSKRKAEYILQGNLLVGLHEQTRLQPQIEQSLAVPLEIIFQGRLPEQRNRTRSMRKPLRRKKAGFSRKLATKLITRMLMSITLPSRELKLGQNVIAPTGVTSFPSDLIKIEDPRCRELVRKFDSQLNTLSGSGAENWASLKDRMSFVVDFFRSHQQYKRMFEPPFLDSQVPAIDAGHMPAGPL